MVGHHSSVFRARYFSSIPLVGLVLLFACGGSEGSSDASTDEGEGVGEWTLALTPQISGTAALLQAVSPVSEEVVWVSGHEGSYARSLDGGANWSTVVMVGEENLQFRDVEAFDANTAYLMSAGSGELSRIYRTDDGGESWQHQFTAQHPDAFLDCVAFWDRDRGLAYGDEVDGIPFILRTLDGGGHWDRVPAAGLPAALDGEGGFAASGSCLITAEGGLAWIATGAGSHPRVLRTEDWGENWTAVDVPVVSGPSSGLTTVQMGPDGRGITLGGTVGGDTLRTENLALTSDGGASWVQGGHPAMLGPIYGSALVQVGGGWRVVAVGPKGMDLSSDLAGDWQTVDTLTYWAVAFATSGVGWAVGPEGRITKLGFGH